MKKYTTLLFYVLLLSFITSCQKASEFEHLDELNQVIPKNILLDAEASTQTFEISKTNDGWSFLGGNDWLNVSKDKNKLILSVKQNTNKEARTATVIVNSKLQSQSINVEQKGVGVVFSAEQKDIHLEQWGEELFIGIDSNVKDWDVICTTSKWLEFDVNTNKKELHIVVKENFDREERVASFFVQTKTGDGDYEIKLSQKGALFHVLPYMGFNETGKEVTDFEKNRKSKLLEEPSGGSSSLAGNTNTNTWIFETVSKAFNRIDYIIEEDARRYRGAMVWAADPMAFVRNNGAMVDDVEKFLKSAGFQERSRNVFYNKEYECVAIISLTEAGSHIRYIFEPQQPAPSPTFDIYPWGILEKTNWRTLTREQINEWEIAHNGKYVTEEANGEAEEITIGYSSNDNGGMIRFYTLSTAEENKGYPLTDVGHVFLDTDKVYFEVKGTVLPTKEFRDLALSAGFVWYGVIGSNVYTFTHSKKQLFMGAYQLLDTDPNDENKILKFAKIDYLHNPAATQNSKEMKKLTENQKVYNRDIAVKKIIRKYIKNKNH